MRMMNSVEASGKFCPFVSKRTTNPPGTYSSVYDWVSCVAGSCMAWVDVPRMHIDAKGKESLIQQGEGFCALIRRKD